MEAAKLFLVSLIGQSSSLLQTNLGLGLGLGIPTGGKIPTLVCICELKRLTENIPNRDYYPQLGILNHQLGIVYPIGDLGFLSQVN